MKTFKELMTEAVADIRGIARKTLSDEGFNSVVEGNKIIVRTPGADEYYFKVENNHLAFYVNDKEQYDVFITTKSQLKELVIKTADREF